MTENLSILDSSTNGNILVEANGVIKAWSREYENLTGIKKDQVIGKNLLDVFSFMAKSRINLEFTVNERNAELEATNEELYATNEELYATNEEFATVNEELYQKNDQLQKEMTARKEMMNKLEES